MNLKEFQKTAKLELEFYSKFYSDISDIKIDTNDLLNLQIGLFECGYFLRKHDGSFSIPFKKSFRFFVNSSRDSPSKIAW